MALSLPEKMVEYDVYTCEGKDPLYVAYAKKNPSKRGEPRRSKESAKKSLSKLVEDTAFGGNKNNY